MVASRRSQGKPSELVAPVRPAPRAARRSRPSRRSFPADAGDAVQLDLLSAPIAATEKLAGPVGAEVRIEHRYPAAMGFLRTYGPETLAVLHDVLAQAEWRDGQLVVRASVRQIAERLGFVSKTPCIVGCAS